MSRAYLILENGDVFSGQSFGYEAEALGELVFSTAMTGYLETLADPRYFGQIVLQTFPLIGNCGIIPADLRDGRTYLNAYIVREWCQEPSNFRSEGELDTFLRRNKVPGLCGIDTRALTRILREKGVMNAMLSKTSELTDEQWSRLRAYKIDNSVAKCSGDTRQLVNGTENNVALWDFGFTDNITEMLRRLGCKVTAISHSAKAEDILSQNPDGLVLSDGPGNPADNGKIISEVKKLCAARLPVFGVGLGHQLLALAHGAKTEKLPFGHRGANQPVREIDSGRVFVTNQNHGYTVVSETLPDTAELSYVNCNDDTCEGVEYIDPPAFSVQFNPPDELYSAFIRMMQERGK